MRGVSNKHCLLTFFILFGLITKIICASPFFFSWLVGWCTLCCSFHIGLVDSMKFASLEANLGAGGAFLYIPFFSLSLSLGGVMTGL